MAPQTDEFGTKVGLLAGLVVLCAARPLLDRFLPAPHTAADDLRAFARRLAGAGLAAPREAPPSRRGRGAVPAGRRRASWRPASRRAGSRCRIAAEVLNNPPAVIDPTTLPPITVDQEVIDYDHELAGPGMQAVVVSPRPEPGAREPGAAASETSPC